MKKAQGDANASATELISQRIAELDDWRGETLSRMRKLIHDADPVVIEEQLPSARHRDWRHGSGARNSTVP